MEVRTIPGQDAETITAPILAAMEKQAQAARAAGHWLEVSYEELSSYPTLARDNNPTLADLLCRLTGKQPLDSVSYGTEAGLYQQAGIPSIICGPGAINRAHRPNEYILESELAECTAMLRSLGAEVARCRAR